MKSDFEVIYRTGIEHLAAHALLWFRPKKADGKDIDDDISLLPMQKQSH